jgi:hypothetical protein
VLVGFAISWLEAGWSARDRAEIPGALLECESSIRLRI